MSLQSRFESKYTPITESGCWIWLGGTNEHGYGILGLGTRAQGVAKAHRVSWTLHNGEIPKGMSILHKCDVPACVNPDHLTVGTLKENSQDMVRKGRCRTPDNRGEKASWAKLDCEKVAHIRRKEMTGIAYAKHYGVSKSAIYQIWAGKNWAG